MDYILKASLGLGEHRHAQCNTSEKKSFAIMKTFKSISRLEQFKTRLQIMSAQIGPKLDQAKMLAKTISIEF